METQSTLSRMRQRLMHVYFRLARPMTLGVRVAVLDGGNRVLLVRHTYLPGWHFPGGGVEAGETLLEAAAKELREEAAIVPAAALSLHGVFYNNSHSRRDHVAVYVLREFTALGERRPDFEIAETGFFPLDELPEGTSRATRDRLAEIAGRSPVSPHW